MTTVAPPLTANASLTMYTVLDSSDLVYVQELLTHAVFLKVVYNGGLLYVKFSPMLNLK